MEGKTVTAMITNTGSVVGVEVVPPTSNEKYNGCFPSDSRHDNAVLCRKAAQLCCIKYIFHRKYLPFTCSEVQPSGF